MKHTLLLAPLAFLFACSKEKTAPFSASELAVNKTVGTYACRAYFVEWTDGALATTRLLRDNTLVISRIDSNTVQLGDASLDIYRTPNNQAWRGHAPAHPAISFANQAYGTSTTYKVLQVDQNSDSIYFENSGSGRSFGRIWKYYGKR